MVVKACAHCDIVWPDMSTDHDAYWGGFFGIAPSLLTTAGVSVVPHVDLVGFQGVWFFVRATRLVVSAPDTWVLHLRRELAEAAPELPSEATLDRLFGASVDRVIGPAFQGALQASEFRELASGSVRAVDAEDAQAVADFRAACGTEDWEAGGLDRAPRYRAAHFENGAITAMAGFRVKSRGAGDPCVLTHPQHRGVGLGKQVVSAVVAAALADDHLLLYQTLEANLASVRLAFALGYVRHANHLAVRLTSDSPTR